MKKNPYRKKHFAMAATGAPVPGNLRNQRGSVVFSDKGELNAYNKKEAMTQLASVLQSWADGEITANYQGVDVSPETVRNERREVLAQALEDKQGGSWRTVGEVVGEEIWETMNREGFLRKLFLYQPIGKGEQARVRIRIKDVVGVQVTGPTTFQVNQIRQRYVYPPEFEIGTHLWIEEKELAQSPGDLIEEKYQDGLEQVMVVEDRVYREAANRAATVSNTLVYFNTLTPSVFTNLRQQIIEWGIPVTTCIMAADLWNDIIADSSFSDWFEPVTKHELILEGTLGSLLGTEIHTDAFRYPNLKVLNGGEIFFNGAPETLGTIMQRQDVQAEPVNNYAAGRAERGWFIFEIVAIQLINTRAVTKGQRI